MRELQTETRPYIVILKDLREFNISETMYNMLKKRRAELRASDIFTLKDQDGFIEFEGELSQVKEFKQRKVSGEGFSTVCGYGVRHPVYNGKYDCTCYRNFGYSERELKRYMQEKHGKTVHENFTQADRREFYTFKKTKTK